MNKDKKNDMKEMMENPMKKADAGPEAPSQNAHVPADKKVRRIAGAPVVNDHDTMTAGPRGPQMFQDVWLFEKHAHFNREVIPERRMHAKGSGAWGTFKVTHDITKYSKAKIFSEIGKETEMFARFSTVAGERGAADAERDIRGFALKFYTEDGNWDMVGNNTPVFFFRDPKRFIDLNHAVKRDPRTNMRSPNTNWDFWSSLPESLHQVTITMSDRGIPASYRYMHGHGSHTYSLINAQNERVWVKFHFRSQQGILNITDQEAEKVVGMDRESHQRDLYEAIENGKFPRWTMFIQVMTEEEASQREQNPFDLTKVWPKDEFPFIEVGYFELNRNPDNYFHDVEQVAMNPSHVVPGIGFSPDRMLQTRLNTYGDAQRYRLGVNHHSIPVNSPRGMDNPHTFHRDGQMRVDGNNGSELHYVPNSFENFQDYHEEHEEPIQAGGDIKFWDFREDDHDYFTQPGQLFRAMTPEQQLVLFENTARNMGDSTLQIKYRHIVHCYMADPAYGEGVAKALGIDINDVDLTPMKSDSRAQWEEDNRRFSDLNKPSPKADPDSAKDLPPQGRDTNVEDPASLYDWKNDPYYI